MCVDRIWMILIDVPPVGTVPDDRPIVHTDQYILQGYTLGIGVASGIRTRDSQIHNLVLYHAEL